MLELSSKRLEWSLLGERDGLRYFVDYSGKIKCYTIEDGNYVYYKDMKDIEDVVRLNRSVVESVIANGGTIDEWDNGDIDVRNI